MMAPVADTGTPVVEVEDLNIIYAGERGGSAAARDVSFSVNRGEIFGLVGETGSGVRMSVGTSIGITNACGNTPITW